MISFIQALLDQAFLQNAVLAGILASVCCGIVGPYVVVKRIGYLAGGIAHSVLGGMGVAYFFGRNPIGGALVAAIIAALIVGWVSLRWRQSEDIIIGALWAIGMALGVLFISLTPGYNVDLLSFLFGNILLVRPEDIYLIAALDAAVIATVLCFYKQLLAVSFDEEFARLRGVHVDWFYMTLLCMVALTVVTLIQVVGLILVIALLTLPAAIARQFVQSLASMMVISVALGVLFTTGGLAISFGPDVPAGATIILLAGACYLIASLGKALIRRGRSYS